MIKSFFVSMFAILLFTLGATASWFYVNMEKDEKKGDEVVVAPVEEARSASPLPSLGGEDHAVLPAVIRGPALDAEEMFKLSAATSAKQEQLKQYEDRLRKHTQRIKVADADTKAAQREVEGALSQARSMMDATEKLLDEVQQAINELKKQSAEITRQSEGLKELEDQAGAGSAASIKTFGEYLQSMPPETAAQTIKEITNGGKIDFAIQLLKQIEARNVSKILAEIDDFALVAELAARFPEVPQVR